LVVGLRTPPLKRYKIYPQKKPKPIRGSSAVAAENDDDCCIHSVILVVEATWASLETGPQIFVEKCTRNCKVLENTATHKLNGIILFIVFSKKSG
jgi:hypothetical protein